MLGLLKYLNYICTIKLIKPEGRDMRSLARLLKLNKMGANTHAIISKNVTPIELVEWLQSLEEVESIKFVYTSSDHHYQFIFKYKGDTRNMSIFTGDYAKNDYGIDGLLTSLGVMGFGFEINERIANHFGGYARENDCGNEDQSKFNEYNMEEYSKTLDEQSLMIMEIGKIVGIEKAYEVMDYILKSRFTICEIL